MSRHALRDAFASRWSVNTCTPRKGLRTFSAGHVHAPGLARSARIYGDQHGAGDLCRAGLRRGVDPGQGICMPSGSTSASARSGGTTLDLPLHALWPALGSAWLVYQQLRLCSVRM
jgi:hypothetical protein